MFQSIRAYYQRLVPRFTKEDLDALESCLIVRTFHKGERIVKAGQVCNYVSYINSGLTRLYYTIDGKDVSIGFVGEGEYNAEYESFLTRQPAAQNIDALTEVEVIDLGFDDMQRLYRDYPVFQEFGRKIAESLFIMLNQRNTALLALTPEERYRNMIANDTRLTQQVPQYMLASFIGVTPEHLSRIRKKISAC
ncbi:MAG: Crp/Fnr family transcriptional regulator [Chitinophagaceae bacterium]|nr:MAG: Crp/Fnr family transcriptional regulator [Chitinophagaceae bacterium]